MGWTPLRNTKLGQIKWHSRLVSCCRPSTRSGPLSLSRVCEYTRRFFYTGKAIQWWSARLRKRKGSKLHNNKTEDSERRHSRCRGVSENRVSRLQPAAGSSQGSYARALGNVTNTSSRQQGLLLRITLMGFPLDMVALPFHWYWTLLIMSILASHDHLFPYEF